jgi:hypothetical protein
MLIKYFAYYVFLLKKVFFFSYILHAPLMRSEKKFEIFSFSFLFVRKKKRKEKFLCVVKKKERFSRHKMKKMCCDMRNFHCNVLKTKSQQITSIKFLTLYFYLKCNKFFVNLFSIYMTLKYFTISFSVELNQSEAICTYCSKNTRLALRTNE